MARTLTPSKKQNKKEYLTKLGNAKYSKNLGSAYCISSSSKVLAGSTLSQKKSKKK